MLVYSLLYKHLRFPFFFTLYGSRSVALDLSDMDFGFISFGWVGGLG
jgi:hypothetical protein